MSWWKELSRFQWIVLTVAWLGWVFDIFDTALFNLAKGPMLKDLLTAPDLAARQAEFEGIIQTIFIVGWAIGGLIFGVLADKVGRTKVLVWTILIYCALTGLTSICQTWEQVAVVRFLAALGIGGEWAAGAALIAEVVPNRARAASASILQTAAAVGPVLAALSNQALAANGWRVLFLVGLVPALLTVVIRLFVPEPERTAPNVAAPKANPLGGLLSNAKWRRNLIVAMILGLVGISGAGNVAYWMPNLVEQGLPKDLDPAMIASKKSEMTYLQHVGTIVGVFLFPWLCDRIGRKLAFASFFVLSLVALWSTLSAQPSFEQLKWIAPLLSLLTIGLTAGFGLYFPELFPTRFRATGCGLAYNVARIGQAPIPWLTGLLIAQAPGQSVSTGVLIAGSLSLIGLLVLPFAPETKGQSLPDE